MGLDSWAVLRHDADTSFGFAVAGVGDVTGDQFADLFVHALLEPYDQGTGTAYLVPGPIGAGGNWVDQVAVELLYVHTGGTLGWNVNRFGGVRSMADLDGDGIRELVVSDWLGTNIEPKTLSVGQGDVHIGGRSLANPVSSAVVLDADFGSLRTYEGDWFGRALDVGDVTGDGWEDVVVTAPETEMPDGTFPGEAYIFAGPIPPGVSADRDAAARIRGVFDLKTPSHTTVAMGEQVVIADLTADGQVDIVISAPLSLVDGSVGAGEVFLFEGPVSGDLTTNDAIGVLEGDSAVYVDNLGAVACSLGDTDGDGYQELGLGATGGTALPTLPTGVRGVVYVVNGAFGGRQPAATRADTTFTGLAPDDETAFVQSAGDLDQDGLHDVAIGSFAIDRDTRGGVFLYYGALPRGSFSIDHAPDAVIRGVDGAGKPYAIAASEDLDGDCMPDLAVGAHGSDAVYILRGGTL